ncbi:MliC family protein [Jhaorihella thermophila]
MEIVYECEQRGVRLPVVFVNTEGGPGLAVMSIEGKLVTMRSTPNGSGVRYVAIDEQDSYRLHAKGETAFVTWLAADHTADEITILRDCWMIDEKKAADDRSGLPEGVRRAQALASRIFSAASLL